MEILINFIKEGDETNDQVLSMLQAFHVVGLNLGRESIDNDLHLFRIKEFKYVGTHRFMTDVGDKVHRLECPLCTKEFLITDKEYGAGTIVSCECGIKIRYDKGFKWLLVSL